VNERINARRATVEDHAMVTAIVAAAFEHDPLWSRALSRPDGTTGHHTAFWAEFVAGALGHHWTWISDGDQAVAVWIPPGADELTPEGEERVTALAHEHLGPTAHVYLEILQRFEAAHPRREGHYYLSLLATDIQHRGKGAGMALLRHNLGLIDAQCAPAYLESSNPANDQRYATEGFQPEGTIVYPGGGLTVTNMWRPARAGLALGRES